VNGCIPEYYVTRLQQIGNWLKLNAQAVYSSKPWLWGYFKEDETIRYTMSKDEKTLYAFLRGWPEGQIKLKQLNESVCVIDHVEMIGCNEELKWTGYSNDYTLKMPAQKPAGQPIYVLKFRIRRE